MVDDASVEESIKEAIMPFVAAGSIMMVRVDVAVLRHVSVAT
jgi:hypothetical protein